ncbi:DsbA family oxidoreductase [Bosea sp. RAF48]|uniref:DsbA family oxidoreductase n=1 Tax=Bosea sp. RAF48 TaxID=3237480 RepID=UPI003F9277B5
MSIPVTIVSDFICPWCLIGERRLARAIESLPENVAVDIQWKPFELNPTMPAEGMNRRTYRSLKFGSWERSSMLDAQTVAAAKDGEAAFDYAAMEKTPNTFAAHRLMHLGERHGVATLLAEALLSGYFERGRDIGDLDTLVEIAAEQGLDRAEAEAFLRDGEAATDVRAHEEAQGAAGLRSVPTFIIGGDIISGAQSVATFEAALRRAAEQDAAFVDGACSIG